MNVHNLSIMFLVLCVNGEENVEQEECDDSKVARMMECAGRQEIVHLTTFRCYQPNTQGPCQNGEVFVLGDNECNAPRCIYNEGCTEGELPYMGKCWDSRSLAEPCLKQDLQTHILMSNAFGNISCFDNSDIADQRSVLFVDTNFSSTAELAKKILMKNDFGKLAKLLCQFHCKKNPDSCK